MRNIKVCILTSAHPSFDSRIFHKEAKTLVHAGYEVVLIVQHDKSEVVDGVRIVPLPKPRNRFTRMFGLTWKAFCSGLKENAKVYHFHDPELMPIGMLLKLLGKRVVYDVHEDLSGQIVDKYWISPAQRKVISFGVLWAERFFTLFFNAVIAATPRIALKFSSKKTLVVQNFPILARYPEVVSKSYQDRGNRVLYIGGLTEGRGILEMVKASQLLPERLNVQLILGGRFSPEILREQVVALPGWGKVNECGWLSRNDVLKYLKEVRLGLVVLRPLPNYIPSYPIKMFEYMNAGIPVVASNFPLWRKIVEEAKCGLLVDPLNPQEIADAVQWLLEHPQEAEEMGLNGQRAVLEKYNWDSEAKKLLDFYKEI